MRTNAFIEIVGTFLPVALLSSCAVVDSSQVSATADYAAYTAKYDAQSNSAQYDAHFSVGGGTGTVLDLNGNSTVTIDGAVMNGQTDVFNDIDYVATENAFTPSTFTESHEFSFVDQSGNTYKNDFIFPSLIAVVSGQSMNASLQKGYVISWALIGGSSDATSVSAVLTRTDGTASAIEVGAPGSTGSIVFSPADLQPLGVSNLTLSLCNILETSDIQADQDGGTLEVSSCSQTYSVTLN